MKKRVNFLVSLIFVLLVSSFFLPILSVQTQASHLSVGRLLSFSQTFPEPQGSVTISQSFLTNVDESTAATTSIGNSLETSKPGYNYIMRRPGIDSAGHRLFYVNENFDDIDESESKSFVVQNTLTGSIISNTALNDNTHIPMDNVGFMYEQSTDRLLGFTQTFPEPQGSVTISETHLVNVDQTSGVTTAIGNSLETTKPGYNNIMSNPALDSVGHRLFYINQNFNDVDESETRSIIVQNTLTGEIINELPVTNELVGMDQVGLLYEASTNRLLAYKQSFPEPQGSVTISLTHLVSLDQTTGVATEIGNSLETTKPGYNNIMRTPGLDPINHKIFFINQNFDDVDETETRSFVVQDTLTGQILNQVPLLGDELLSMDKVGFLYEVASQTVTPTPTPQPETATINATADTYIKSGSDNRNTGAGTFMRLQSSGNNRALVYFDQNAIQSQIGNKTVISAKLRLSIIDNGNNWGTTGRTVDVHRLTKQWKEGNGTENSRGTGEGVTWSCAIDSVIENSAKNCSTVNEWEMGQPNNPSVHPWIAQPSDSKIITNNQSGVVEYDVTADVASFVSGANINYGWIVKKTDEGQAGQVSFGTRESSSLPQLVVTYQ